MGRSGSTVLHGAIVEAIASRRQPSWRIHRRIINEDCWDLATWRPHPSIVCKTHDYAESLRPDVKSGVDVVFIHGDVSWAVASVASQTAREGPGWLREHYAHLKSPATTLDDLYRFDAIRAFDQLQSWDAATGLRLCIVSYDAVWERQAEIGAFLGLPLQLPEKRPRAAITAEILNEHGEQIRSAYREAIRRQQAMPEFAIREP